MKSNMRTIKAAFLDLMSLRGRSTRKQYWTIVVGNALASILAFFLLGGLLGLLAPESGPEDFGVVRQGMALFLMLVAFAVAMIAVWIGYANLVRRLHDRGHSAWTVLTCLIPVVGFWWLLVCGFFPGRRGKNRYGNDPLGGGIEDAFADGIMEELRSEGALDGMSESVVEAMRSGAREGLLSGIQKGVQRGLQGAE